MDVFLRRKLCRGRSVALAYIRFASRSSKKGDQAAEEKVTFGKVGNSLKCGVVGVPNVGKSSFFNLVTNGKAKAENYPFCTIDPNDGRVAVPDARLDKLCEMYKPQKRTPSYLHVTDIAGLVKGAHEGKGLGNAFLNHISAVDGIYHLCRGFDSIDVSHVEGTVDPVRDLEIIAQELRLKDLEYLETRLPGLKMKIKKDAVAKTEYDTLLKAHSFLENGTADVRNGEWSEAEVRALNPHFLLTAKPAIYILNVSKDEYVAGEYKYLSAVEEYVGRRDSGRPLVIPFSVQYEQEVLDGVEEALAESAVPAAVRAGFRCLNLISFFTVGADEVRAWPVHMHCKAAQAAGRIHTDFEKTFILAEVCSYDDVIQHGDEAAVKAAGKQRRQGKEYKVADGDVMHFKCGSRKK
ncbi:obg-like ATPase 1 [Sycon ciliatum]|uniref:obg-like ATPase 1 n=1 Tax=Sycon ciliatum TaxID=27933 RepID=UPI0020AB46B6|eukprot:scpid42278/ scgid11218/ Obg-like ATPase 1